MKTDRNPLRLKPIKRGNYLQVRCVGRSQTGDWNCEHCRDEGDEQKSSYGWPSQSRKESILNCLLNGTRGFINKRVDKETDQENALIRKNGSKKITDFLEEGKTEMAGKVNAGMKTWQPVWNDLLVHERKDKLMLACLKRLWAWKIL